MLPSARFFASIYARIPLEERTINDAVIAEQIGVNRHTVTDWRRGRVRVPLRVVFLLCQWRHLEPVPWILALAAQWQDDPLTVAALQEGVAAAGGLPPIDPVPLRQVERMGRFLVADGEVVGNPGQVNTRNDEPTASGWCELRAQKDAEDAEREVNCKKARAKLAAHLAANPEYQPLTPDERAARDAASMAAANAAYELRLAGLGQHAAVVEEPVSVVDEPVNVHRWGQLPERPADERGSDDEPDDEPADTRPVDDAAAQAAHEAWRQLQRDLAS